MSRLVQVAWMLPSLWLLPFAARVLIADLTEGRSCCDLSWCGCEIDCEATR